MADIFKQMSLKPYKQPVSNVSTYPAGNRKTASKNNTGFPAFTRPVDVKNPTVPTFYFNGVMKHKGRSI